MTRTGEDRETTTLGRAPRHPWKQSLVLTLAVSSSTGTTDGVVRGWRDGPVRSTGERRTGTTGDKEGPVQDLADKVSPKSHRRRTPPPHLRRVKSLIHETALLAAGVGWG